MAESAIESSYAWCRRVARSQARNFYYGFLLLPRQERDALCALYAFMRRVDDFSDTAGAVEEKQRQLARWRAGMDRALAGEAVLDGSTPRAPETQVEQDPVWPAFRHAVQTYGIPTRYFHDVISGAEMDLTVSSYATFDRLREYCYRVAGAVGLACLYVFGFTDPRAPGFAEKLGIAFQLTNILRDLARDFEMGRTYLPQEDLERFGCAAEDLAGPTANPGFRELMVFEADRAWRFYEEGWQLLPLVSADSRPALWALARIYSGILEEIESRNFDVFTRSPVRLSTRAKIWVLLQARLAGPPRHYDFQERHRHRRRIGGTGLGRHAG